MNFLSIFIGCVDKESLQWMYYGVELSDHQHTICDGYMGWGKGGWAPFGENVDNMCTI